MIRNTPDSFRYFTVGTLEDQPLYSAPKENVKFRNMLIPSLQSFKKISILFRL